MHLLETESVNYHSRIGALIMVQMATYEKGKGHLLVMERGTNHMSEGTISTNEMGHLTK